jgi:hypothetical protein
MDRAGRRLRPARRFDPEPVGMAVVVQRMVRAEAAGVLCAANPVTAARDEAVVDASSGLGEVVVAGPVIPDQVVVGKMVAPDQEAARAMAGTTHTARVPRPKPASWRPARASGLGPLRVPVYLGASTSESNARAPVSPFSPWGP